MTIPRGYARSFSLPRVPTRYEPRYPRSLTPEEFRELVARRMPGRLSRAAALASVAFSLAACEPEELTPKPPSNPARPAAPPDLEARILTLLESMSAKEAGGYWFANSTFRRATAAETKEGSARWIARIPICYGNSYSGIFDVKLARDLASDAFAAYGLKLARNVHFAGAGMEATIDGYDAASGLGFELHDVEKSDPSMFGPGEFAVDKIDPKDALDEVEAKALARAGFAIHVAAPQPLYDGDEFTAMMTYLAGILDFLNAATDGQDFDVAGLMLTRREIVVPRAVIEPPVPGLDTKPNDTHIQFRCNARRTIRLPIDIALAESFEEGTPAPTRGAAESKPSKPLTAPLSNRGRPSIVLVGAYVAPGSSIRLVQKSAAGGEDFSIESKSGRFLLPSRFDVARPFEIVITAEPGDVTIDRHVVVGVVPET